MIEIIEYVEETIGKILTDAKAQNYKFNVPYPYTVDSCYLDQICAILLKLNISVELKYMNDATSDIEVTFLNCNKVAKFKYTISNIHCIIQGETDYNGLIIDKELEDDMSIRIPHIINRLRFDD